MSEKMVAPCSRQADTARDIPFASATDTPDIRDPHAPRQIGCASKAVTGAQAKGFRTPKKSATAKHETANSYERVVARLCDDWRVIVCKDNIQWILQRRKKGGAERPWRAVSYCCTREALIRLCATSCGQIDPDAAAALAALPENF